MNLEYIALGLLILVLVVRWGTARHKSHLRLTGSELTNEHSRLKAEHDRLFDRRSKQESAVERLKQERAAVENQLQEVKDALQKQRERNRELAE